MLVGLWAIALIGCGKKDPEERNVEADPDALPLDTDVTAGGGGGGIPGDLFGTIELDAELPYYGGDCDSTLSLHGTPYTGLCPGCDFNFTVDVATERDDGTNCPTPEDGPAMLSMATYRLWLTFYHVIFQFSPYFEGGTYYGDAASAPALLWGVEYYPDPLAWALLYPGSKFGEVVQNGNTIDWTVDWSWTYVAGYPNYFQSYCYPSYAGATAAYVGDVTDGSTVPCDPTVGDRWTFEGEENATAMVTVDSVSADTLFDARIWVNNPTECVELHAFDNFPCSHDEKHLCPSAQFLMDDGQYEIIVVADGWFQLPYCAGDVGAYEIALSTDGTSPPALVLAGDDVALYDEGEYQHNWLHVEGSVSIAE